MVKVFCSADRTRMHQGVVGGRIDFQNGLGCPVVVGSKPTRVVLVRICQDRPEGGARKVVFLFRWRYGGGFLPDHELVGEFG